jgi:UDP:flavonoid glycosyltransferase YjiC (YdhE family)
MRVLFVPLASPTHYWPMVPVAWACRAAGHEVRVAGQPSLIEPIKKTGMTAVRVGEDFDVMLAYAALREKIFGEIAEHTGQPGLPANPKDLPPALQRRLMDLRFGPQAELTEAVAEDLVELATQWRPDIVIGDPLMHYPPVLAAEVCGAKLVRHLWGPDFTVQIQSFPGVGTAGGGADRDQWPAPMLAIFDRYGIEVRDNFSVMTLDPTPASTQLPGVPNLVSFGCQPYNGPGEVPAWLLTPPSKPRVCVTLGTGTTRWMGAKGFFVTEIVAELAGLDAEIVVAIKAEDRELLKDSPANVRTAAWLPLNTLLPTCSAIVHQGGAGTTQTSAFCGVPQVIVPQVMDQEFNANQMAIGGSVVAVKPAQIAETGQSGSSVIVETVGTMLEDGNAYTQAALAIQKEVTAQPTPAKIVGKLEALVS